MASIPDSAAGALAEADLGYNSPCLPVRKPPDQLSPAYRRRIESGLRRGLTRQQAAGKPRAKELPALLQGILNKDRKGNPELLKLYQGLIKSPKKYQADKTRFVKAYKDSKGIRATGNPYMINAIRRLDVTLREEDKSVPTKYRRTSKQSRYFDSTELDRQLNSIQVTK